MGRQTLRVKMIMSTEMPYHFDHLLQVLKKITLESDFIHIFLMFSCMYIAPGCQQKAQITLTICCKFQNDLFEF